jgi:hypothetical protein
VLCCLLKQLAHPLGVSHPCFEYLYEKIEHGAPKPTLSVLVELFIKCSGCFSSFSVILDAFDECGQQDRILRDVVKPFYLSGTRIYITTRSHLRDTFKREFERATIVSISSNDDDIRSYISQELQAKKPRLTEEFRTKIIEEIGSRAAGMY